MVSDIRVREIWKALSTIYGIMDANELIYIQQTSAGNRPFMSMGKTQRLEMYGLCDKGGDFVDEDTRFIVNKIFPPGSLCMQNPYEGLAP